MGHTGAGYVAIAQCEHTGGKKITITIAISQCERAFTLVRIIQNSERKVHRSVLPLRPIFLPSILVMLANQVNNTSRFPREFVYLLFRFAFQHQIFNIIECTVTDTRL